MALDLHDEPRVDRLEVVDSVRPRLADVAGGRDLDAMINAAIDELGAVKVTTYLSILVERRVRARLGEPV
jgi:hypothetical protein